MVNPDQLICSDSQPLYYCEAGDADGSPIIMIHGWGADHRYFDFQLEPLKKYRLIIPELEGLGSSPEPPEYSIHREAVKVVQLALGLGIDKAAILGHSLGGMVAQEIALSFPDFVHALILEDTSPGVRNFPLTQLVTAFSFLLCGTTPGLRKFLAKRWGIAYENSDGAAGALIAEYACGSCSKTLARYVKAMRRWNALPHLDSIRIPTLVVQGELDRMIHMRQARTLVEKINSSELVTISGSGHTPHLERPEAFNLEVTAYLERIGW